MLLWQPQNSLRVRSVFLVSLALHVLVCFALLFVYKDYHQRLVIDLSSRIPSNAIVKLLPLSASRPSSQVLGVKGGKKGGVQKSGKKSKAQQVKKKSPTSLVKQIVTSKSAKAAKGKKEALKKAKNSVQTKKQKLAEQKKLKKKEAESSSAKAMAGKKEVAEKESKPVEQPAKEEQKIIEPEVTEPLKQEATETTGQLIPEGTVGSAVGPEGQEILYLTKQEFDALQIQQKLQECLFDLWTPPAGIPLGALCEVLITVGWDGAILETQFLKKTEILMYDLSVQETLEQVIFPHEVWGKQITIAFKP